MANPCKQPPSVAKTKRVLFTPKEEEALHHRNQDEDSRYNSNPEWNQYNTACGTETCTCELYPTC